MKKKPHNPFSVPENYFERLEEPLVQRALSQDKKHPKAAGFTVPEGYFDHLEATLAKKTAQHKKVIPLKRYRKWYWAAAVAVLTVLFFSLPPKSTPAPNFQGLALADMAFYLEEQGSALSDAELAQTLSMDELETLAMDGLLLEDTALYDYLDKNIEDLETQNIYEDD
ncbi:hypothetical protein [Maribacter sp. 2307ULW6-5]|uniref:hypothetical protein n=1 Tax=Maribacter sp. 2307ULW6-5 TaxID=3386275 RepID=UPI0039BCD666